MDVDKYEELTGKTVIDETLIEANILRAKSTLELQLGYTLDEQDGSSIRIFPIGRERVYLIDPISEIESAKLQNGSTEYILDEEEYILMPSQGIVKYLRLVNRYCSSSLYLQLVVEGTWEFSDLPNDLLLVWADLVTYYADGKKDISSESLGTHSYTRKLVDPLALHKATLQKYAGGNGRVYQLPI